MLQCLRDVGSIASDFKYLSWASLMEVLLSMVVFVDVRNASLGLGSRECAFHAHRKPAVTCRKIRKLRYMGKCHPVANREWTLVLCAGETSMFVRRQSVVFLIGDASGLPGKYFTVNQ